MSEWQDIGSANKNGEIIRIGNLDHKVFLDAYWQKKRKQWEGVSYGAMGVIKVKWCPKDAIQPTHWRKIEI